jgi:hypothetical protein
MHNVKMKILYAVLLGAFVAAAIIGEMGHRDIAEWMAFGVAAVALAVNWRKG